MMLPLITMLVFGPYRQKKFGKPGHRDAEVRAGVAVPLLVQVDAVAALHRHRREELRRLVAGAVEDDVGLVHRAVGHHDARRR